MIDETLFLKKRGGVCHFSGKRDDIGLTNAKTKDSSNSSTPRKSNAWIARSVKNQ